ncbi:MAG: hypothetical protein LBJ11_00885 [Oscillospiraceae bacterium]|nr:hypothetical protein [Oscillospiraceae bacterium]
MKYENNPDAPCYSAEEPWDHHWDGCESSDCGAKASHYYGSLSYHDWDGCICKQCGTKAYYLDDKREMHDLDDHCRCRKCGFVYHDWDGCTCTRCGKHRDQNHDWDGCTCKRCGKVKHTWDSCRCGTCGEINPDESAHTFDGCT